MVHISGIVVYTRPREVADCARRVSAVPGVEVRYLHPESGRLVVVQETATAAAQEEGLRRLQALPGVLTAALVEHRFDGEEPPAEPDQGATGR